MFKVIVVSDFLDVEEFLLVKGVIKDVIEVGVGSMYNGNVVNIYVFNGF